MGVARRFGVNDEAFDTRATMNRQASTRRNPFGVADVPDPNGTDVEGFAAKVDLSGSANDPNAQAWPAALGVATAPDSIEGSWRSRWNGGADPTIAGDSCEAWKDGRAEVKMEGDRVYILFDWNDGARRGLLDARHDGPNRLKGRYINLSDPSITRPWAGRIIDKRRIDGRWTSGRLDFRR